MCEKREGVSTMRAQEVRERVWAEFESELEYPVGRRDRTVADVPMVFSCLVS